MKKIEHVDVLAIILALDTYLFVGPFVTSLFVEIEKNFLASEFGLYNLINIFPLIVFFFFYKFAYKKLMKILDPAVLPLHLEKNRMRELHNNASLVSSQAAEKFFKNKANFVKGLFPVAVLILVVGIYYISKSNFSFSLTDYMSIGFWNFYTGLLIVICNFYPKHPSR